MSLSKEYCHYLRRTRCSTSSFSANICVPLGSTSDIKLAFFLCESIFLHILQYQLLGRLFGYTSGITPLLQTCLDLNPIGRLPCDNSVLLKPRICAEMNKVPTLNVTGNACTDIYCYAINRNARLRNVTHNGSKFILLAILSQI